jgi:nucleotide-binding universal stress UspA family protein
MPGDDRKAARRAPQAEGKRKQVEEGCMTPIEEAGAAPLLRIFHPSDFSKASEVAFAHALKLALESKAELEIMHVARHLADSAGDVHWTDFPGVRATLARWGILPAEAAREAVAKTGMDVKKVVLEGSDPVESMVQYCREHPPDLLVLATHQRDGLGRWLHKEVAEPLARQSHAMTLFVPHDGNGFVSLENGTVTLRRILIPVDHEPSAQPALQEAFFLAAGLGKSKVEFRLIHVGTHSRGMPTLQLPDRPDWQWEKRVVEGDVVDRILQEEAEWSPDLMVLTTQGHRDFLDALRGSTTERVVRGARCPVLAIPA